MGKHRSRSRSRNRDLKYKKSYEEDLKPSSSRKTKEKERRRSKDRRDRSSDSGNERSRDRRDKNERHRSRSPKQHKSKKSKKRRESSSSSSSSESSANLSLSKDFLEKLEAQRKKELEEKKKYKEQLKALETPEEKRRRRLLKKQEKERKRKELMGWDGELLHYTNADNPFGDSNLHEKYVWKKKLEKEGKTDLTPEEIEREIRMKQLANREELEKVKARRQQREAEKMAREEEMAAEQRSKEAHQFQEWQKHEDQFHLEQARLRSKIRIQDGRAKPIDVLAQYIDSESNPDTVEMHEPYFYLLGLTLIDLEDLLADIKVYMELENESSNLDYWNDLIVIVEDEVRALRKVERESKSEYEAAMGRQEGINKAVAQDVRNTLKNKSAQALAALKAKVEQKIASRQEGVDISYWETLHSHIKAEIARARLRDRHAVNLRRKLEILKAQQGLLSSRAATDDSPRVAVKSEPEEEAPAPERPSSSIESEERQEERDDDEEKDDHDQVEQDMLQPCLEAYESGRYSPVYMQQSQVEPGQFIYDEEDDWARLEFSRAKVQGKATTTVEPSTAEMDAFSMEERAMRGVAQKDMSADEAIFSVESSIDKPVYLWSDKYRPRKPRYFNRVHTGFEWNKYNQTHYDMDNPPPKIVQGYKFNIFYPDLINKNATPQYTVTPCADNREFAILRFSAGPPYEDIAFKIVNREWEYSYKKGFRCQFHNNIMQLWFHFKRYRYRR